MTDPKPRKKYAPRAERKILTPKEHEFIKAYLKTGNGTEAVLKTYGKKMKVITARNWSAVIKKRPPVKAALEKVLSIESLERAHAQLLNQKKIEFFVFPKNMSDEEIEDKVTGAGLEVVNIQPGEKGKYAFYSMIDANARKSALDMAYKRIGAYAPDKSVRVNVDVEANPEIQELTQKLNELYRGGGASSDGGKALPVGTETQNKE